MRYRVKHHSEEFACPTCGAPVYVGDGAWQDGHDGDCFCSAYCAGHCPDAHLNGVVRPDNLPTPKGWDHV